MDREIKFRALRTDGKRWVYGFLVVGEEATYIVYKAYNDDYDFAWKNVFIEVIHESVGQYTGLKDKNGVEIYEGDLLNWKCSKSGSKKERNYIVEIYWHRHRYALTIHHEEKKWATGKSYWNESDRKLIGNIHENPGLI